MYVLSYQQRKRRGIVLCDAVSRGLCMVQYLLLFAFEGAVLDILGTVASVLVGKRTRRKEKIEAIAFDGRNIT